MKKKSKAERIFHRKQADKSAVLSYIECTHEIVRWDILCAIENAFFCVAEHFSLCDYIEMKWNPFFMFFCTIQ